jgi:dTDP-4-amino-4,6-dideoxygalactose transaminase
MAEINGALALRGLTGLEQRISRRNIIRARYEENLRNVPGIHFQRISQGSLSACKDFSILVDKKHFGQTRDQLVSHLRQQNIDARRYFSPPVHQQKLYSELWDRRPLPVTEYVSSSVVSLPVYSSLTNDAVDAICDVIRRKQQ